MYNKQHGWNLQLSTFKRYQEKNRCKKGQEKISNVSKHQHRNENWSHRLPGIKENQQNAFPLRNEGRFSMKLINIPRPQQITILITDCENNAKTL